LFQTVPGGAAGRGPFCVFRKSGRLDTWKQAQRQGLRPSGKPFFAEVLSG